MANHRRIALSVLLLGLVGIGAVGAFLSWQSERTQTATSDAAHIKRTLRIGVDGWVGYFPLCSPEMEKRLFRDGYRIECINDGGAYDKRYPALKSGDLDLAVGTVDSYLLHGREADWSGSIVAVLDESKGGDALVAYEEEIASLDDLKQKEKARIALTPNSPSHHLLKSLAVHFDIERLKADARWALYTDGSTAALAALKAKRVSAAVLWEPDVSKALRLPGVKRIIGTESTEKLIVDVLLVGRNFARNNPDVLRDLLNAYFRTLRHYRSNRDDLYRDLSRWTGLDADENAELVNGVAWAGLTENAGDWYGLADPLADVGLTETIQSSIDVLDDFAGAAKVQLPDNDPFRLIYSAPIKQLYSVLQQSGDLQDPGQAAPRFAHLSDRQWLALDTVGTLKVRPVGFLSGSDELTDDGKRLLDDAAGALKHYPSFRLLIAGHTSTQGDPVANRKLSQSRAEAVLRYLRGAHGFADNRLGAIGFGGEQPLKRKPGEPLRAYRYRLPRVELVLKQDPI